MFPSSFDKLIYLKYLYIFNDEREYEGTPYTNANTIYWLSSLVFNIPSLIEITLNYLNMQGSIPSSIASLTNLTVLNLAYNNLNGQIPNEIGSLQNLQILELQSNQFSGIIPTTIQNLSNLTIVELYQNQLSGSIPVLSNSQQLSVLDVRDNNLSGNWPYEYFSDSSFPEFSYLGANFNPSLQTPDICLRRSFCMKNSFSDPVIGNMISVLPDESKQLIQEADDSFTEDPEF